MSRAHLLRIRLLLSIFVLGHVASGLTAIPLQWEVGLLERWVGKITFIAQAMPGLVSWIRCVNEGVPNGYGKYPFLAYGTDWLAFGHMAIAVAFLGPLRDPIRNVWVIEFGMIACVLVLPWALLFGPHRGIPPGWTLIDMSFGVLGFLPLWFARRSTLEHVKEV